MGLLVLVAATLAVVNGGPAPRGVRKLGRVRSHKTPARKLDPDINNMDLSLFREHEEGFPGDLFYEDSEGEAEMQEIVPSWRQAGKAGKSGTGFDFNTKKCGKAAIIRGSTKASSKVGKGKASAGKGGISTKAPSYAPTVACVDYPTMAPVVAPSVPGNTLPTPGSPTTGGGTPTSKGDGGGGTPTSGGDGGDGTPTSGGDGGGGDGTPTSGGDGGGGTPTSGGGGTPTATPTSGGGGTPTATPTSSGVVPTAGSPPTATPTSKGLPTASPTSLGLPTDGGGAPTVSKGKDKDPKPADFDASDANCAAIAASPNLKSGGPATSVIDLDLPVEAELQVRSKNNIDVEALLDKYSKYVRLYVLGCFDEAEAELSSVVQRRLMTEPLFQATMDDWSEDTDSCDGSDPKTCDYANEVIVYYEDNGNDEPDEKIIRERIKEALSKIAQEMEANPDIDDVKVGRVDIAKAVESEADGSETNRAGMIVGATAGALALLLLLMFLAKRNRDDDQVSHLKFVDDDETFVQEFESKNDSGGIRDRRTAHVVGESDSVMSGWTGYSMDEEDFSQDSDRSGRLGHPTGDVHLCSSATCEVCERRRQMGVTFVKTSTPPVPSRPNSLPSDASREYVAEDVVAL
eukprot:scaffold3015_cov122-Cylindrotheca_fusiformis.AAC.11